MKRLLIKKCSDPMFWYADMVGQYVDYVREDSEGFWSREPAGHLNVIRRSDAEVITDEV